MYIDIPSGLFQIVGQKTSSALQEGKTMAIIFAQNKVKIDNFNIALFYKMAIQ